MREGGSKRERMREREDAKSKSERKWKVVREDTEDEECEREW